MMRSALLAAAIAIATLAGANAAQGQAVKRQAGMTSTSTRTRGGDADANVRRDESPNPVNKPPTPEPIGKSTRGPTPLAPGQICVDSRVDLQVKIYVDGNFAGSVSPWGDSCGFYGPGEHRLYARAVYTDGSASSWGPVVSDATAGFRWTIRP